MFDFAALVGFLALSYAAVVKFLQGRLVNRSETEAVQAESKRLSAEFATARKSGDKKTMDRLMQQQMELLPKMNKVMMGQMKPMFVILGVFAVFMWGVGALDPFTKDDIHINLTDDGQGCDKAAGDYVFSACLPMEGGNVGKWTVNAKAYEGGAELASNETYFLYGAANWSDTYTEAGKGEGLELATERRAYEAGQSVLITAAPANMTKGTSFIVTLAPPRQTSVDRVEAIVSNGTYFKVDLPLAIPVLNVKSIYQPYWWFIFVSLIGNLGISFVWGQYQKIKKSEGKK